MNIYEIKNKVNNKIYIGYSTKFNSNEEFLNSNYWGSGIYIVSAIKKYGKEIFERRILLKNIFDKRELKRYEILWIKKKNSKSPNGYNLTNGGDGGCGGDTFTNNPNKEEIREKIKNKRKLQIITKKTRIKMSNSKLGEKNNCFGRIGNKHPMFGKIPWNKGIPPSKETRIKIGIALIGHKYSSSSIVKMSIKAQKRWDEISKEKRKEIGNKISETKKRKKEVLNVA